MNKNRCQVKVLHTYYIRRRVRDLMRRYNCKYYTNWLKFFFYHIFSLGFFFFFTSCWCLTLSLTRRARTYLKSNNNTSLGENTVYNISETGYYYISNAYLFVYSWWLCIIIILTAIAAVPYEFFFLIGNMTAICSPLS